MRGEQKKKIREIKFGNYRRCKFGPHYLLTQQASLRQYIGAAQVYPSLILQQISWTLFAAFCLPIRQDITYWFCFTGAETEIHKIKDDSKINREKNIDRRGSRQIGTVWHIPDPHSVSLPTTFKRVSYLTVIIVVHSWLARVIIVCVCSVWCDWIARGGNPFPQLFPHFRAPWLQVSL